MINTALKYMGLNTQGKLTLMDYYNSKIYPLIDNDRKYKIKPNDNWCAMFCSVIAHKCGLTKEQFPYECSVMEQVKLARANKTFTTDVKEVKAGDLIIYDWNTDKWSDHVGIVINTNGDNIHVIEGNIKNTVGYRTIPKTSKSIQGFIKVKVEQMTDSKVTSADERIANLARLTWAGEFGTGDKRKVLLGADFEAVQRCVNIFYT